MNEELRMKTCQSKGYFKQAQSYLMLCFVSSLLSAGPALALTGNNINACFDCHGSASDIRPVDTVLPNSTSVAYRNISTGAIKGSHRTHVTNLKSTAVPADCTPCHGTPAITSTDFAHRDGQINIASAVTYSRPTFFNQTSVPILGTCGTASCHISSYGTGSVVSPTWGTVSGCAACHNSSLGANAAFDATYGAPLTGTHTMHMAAAVACNKCHSNVAKDTNTSSVHINSFINISGYTTKQIAKHPINAGYGTCTTTQCHGTASPSWAAGTSNVSCTKCHGKPTLTNYSATNAWQAAPGYAQSAGAPYTNGVSATPAYGAHDAHVRAVNQYTTRDTLCSDCHGVLPTSGLHANRSTDMSFSNLAKNVGTTFATRATLNPAYNKTTYTCTAVYCHGDGGVFLGTPQGTGMQPKWNETAYLTPYAKNVTVCGKCHGALPVVPKKNHTGIAYTAGTCNGCHGHDGNGANHIDGVLQASGACDGCHGYQAGSWAAAPVINAEGKGAHEKHIVYLTTKRFAPTTIVLTPATDGYASATTAWTDVCGVCHGNTATNHNNGTVNISIATTYLFGASGSPSYAGTPGQLAANNKNCSNISCHYFTTPLWSTY